MGSIGGPELLIVLIVALLVLGPTRLPQAARQMGRAVSEFRRVTSEFQSEVRSALDDQPRTARRAPAPTLPPKSEQEDQDRDNPSFL